MNMEYHKIRGVKMNTCTAEAKISYNLAFAYAQEYRSKYRSNKEKFPETAISDFIYEAVQHCIKLWKCSHADSKYNVDAIQACLNAGLRNYFEGDIILDSYEKIGAVFPSLYLK